MAEDTVTNEETAEAAAGPAPKEKNQSGALGRRAKRALRRARAVYEENEWQDSREASFLVEEATVLALMDLAEAVREQNPDAADQE